MDNLGWQNSAVRMFPGEDAENVFQSGFAAAWENVKKVASTIRLSPKCSKCQMRDQCRACAAMAVTETGRFDQVPEYRCQMTHAFDEAIRDLECQILKDREEYGKTDDPKE